MASDNPNLNTKVQSPRNSNGDFQPINPVVFGTLGGWWSNVVESVSNFFSGGGSSSNNNNNNNGGSRAAAEHAAAFKRNKQAYATAKRQAAAAAQQRHEAAAEQRRQTEQRQVAEQQRHEAATEQRRQTEQRQVAERAATEQRRQDAQQRHEAATEQRRQTEQRQVAERAATEQRRQDAQQRRQADRGWTPTTSTTPTISIDLGDGGGDTPSTVIPESRRGPHGFVAPETPVTTTPQTPADTSQPVDNDAVNNPPADHVPIGDDNEESPVQTLIDDQPVDNDAVNNPPADHVPIGDDNEESPVQAVPKNLDTSTTSTTPTDLGNGGGDTPSTVIPENRRGPHGFVAPETPVTPTGPPKGPAGAPISKTPGDGGIIIESISDRQNREAAINAELRAEETQHNQAAADASNKQLQDMHDKRASQVAAAQRRQDEEQRQYEEAAFGPGGRQAYEQRQQSNPVIPTQPRTGGIIIESITDRQNREAAINAALLVKETQHNQAAADASNKQLQDMHDKRASQVAIQNHKEKTVQAQQQFGADVRFMYQAIGMGYTGGDPHYAEAFNVAQYLHDPILQIPPTLPPRLVQSVQQSVRSQANLRGVTAKNTPNPQDPIPLIKKSVEKIVPQIFSATVSTNFINKAVAIGSIAIAIKTDYPDLLNTFYDQPEDDANKRWDDPLKQQAQRHMQVMIMISDAVEEVIADLAPNNPTMRELGNQIGAGVAKTIGGLKEAYDIASGSNTADQAAVDQQNNGIGVDISKHTSGSTYKQAGKLAEGAVELGLYTRSKTLRQNTGPAGRPEPGMLLGN